MIDISLLQDMLEQGYIIRQKHPLHNIWIYNYTALTQYERAWNSITKQCRGLILNKNYQIIARPFEKFFNLGEQENQYIPAESFKIYEKLDGSLGILYWLDGKPFIATRGSFTSVQSQMANAILQNKYQSILDTLQPDKTYLFEIIYPANRVVVNYGNLEDLVLLAIIDNATGQDVPLEAIGFPLVQQYDGIEDIHQLQSLAVHNKEGFVIKFEHGLRYKVKFDAYVHLHRMITQVSSISIWEYLAAGRSLDEVLEQMPDEFYPWIKKTQNNLLAAYNQIERQCQKEFRAFPIRKETAAYFQTCTYPDILFAMLDGKSYDRRIWQKIRPQFEKPFF